ncbi:hypothetical protein [Paenibacillus sp. BAC0078]
MSRIGKKLVVVGIWTGIGILIGMQFGGSVGSKVARVLPGWNGATGTVQTAPTSQASGLQNNPAAGKVQGGQAYVYLPVTVDPATGAYTVAPVQTQSPADSPSSGNLPQQEVKDYSTKSPEQLLIPEEQKPTVDKLADKTAGLLQQASQKSIRWVVSLFDSAEE